VSEQAPSDSVVSRSVDRLWHEVRDQVRRQVAPDRADDVVQEAFLRALRRPPPDSSGMSGWLKVVARHVAIRSERGERNRREREREIARERPSHTAEDDPPIDGRAALQLLDALEDPYRQVLRMRYLDGLEIAEVARALARPEVTVRSQIKRGLDRIRERLGLPSTRRKLPALVPLGWLRSRLARGPARAAALVATIAVGVIATLLVQSSPERPGLAPIDSIAAVPSAAPPDLAPAAGAVERRVAEPLPAASTAPADEWTWSFEGRVVDAGGRPVGSAAIRIGAFGDDRPETGAHSDEAGRFRIERADATRWVWAHREGHLPSPRHRVASIDPSREFELALGPELAVLAGRVTTHDGVAVPGATVVVVPKTTKDGSQAGSMYIGPQGTIEIVPLPTAVVCDDAGAFRLPCASGEPVRLLVSSPGTASLIRTVGKPVAHEEVLLVLPRGGSVAGRLVDRDGAPQSGRSVRLDLPRTNEDRETLTGPDGTFRFATLPECTFELLESGESPRDGASFFEMGELEVDEELWLDVVVGLENTLRGRAVRDGAPLAGWPVELERRESVAFPDRRTRRTGARGEFSFPSCSPDAEYVVRLRDPDSGRAVDWEKARVPGDPLELVADAARSVPGNVRGTIVAADPAHPAVYVELSNSNLSERWPARVDPESGAFSIRDVPPGTHVLRGWVLGLGPVKLAKPEITAGATTELELALPAPGILSVRVSSATALDPERIQVVVWVPALYFTDGGLTTRSLALHPDGDYRCLLPPAEHRCLLYVDGKYYDERLAVVEPGATRHETFEVGDDVSVLFQLRPSRPIPVSDRNQLRVTIEHGDQERSFFLGVGLLKNEIPNVRLPRDTTRIVVATPSGLTGEWKRTGDKLPKTIVIPLAPGE
jgi:RNA polymerase sigma factor (sigma-70 family)